jgi:hypothetical protein
MLRKILVAVPSVLLVAACGSSQSSQTQVEATPHSGDDDDAGTLNNASDAARSSTDAANMNALDATNMNALDATTDATVGNGGNPLFESLFGQQDPSLSGKSCTAARDRCRGSNRLFICINDAGEALGTGQTCRPCSTDEQCRFEYSYLEDQFSTAVVCGADGSCHLGNDPIGTCGTASSAAGYACRTALLGWYACVNGQCAKCTTDSQCQSVYGPNWLCSPSMGNQCMESIGGVQGRASDASRRAPEPNDVMGSSRILKF